MMSSYPVVVGLLDETKRQILFRLREFSVCDPGIYKVLAEACCELTPTFGNKVKESFKNPNAQKIITLR